MPSKRKGKKKSMSPNVSISTPAPHTHPKPRKSTDRLMMRFYEPLVLQHVLDPTRGSHIRCEPLDGLDESELDNCRLRRSFVNSLAYICDFKRGGTTVTAIALEMRPAGVVFWVAANENVQEKVVLSLEGIFKDLVGLDSSAGAESTATVEERTFRRAVELGMPRVNAYRKMLERPLETWLAILESEQNKGMIAWLSSLKDHKDMLHLCRFSYDARASPYMKELTRRSEKGSVLPCMGESNASTFLTVRHLIGRLGSHMKAAKTLVAAAMRFPSFFDDCEIKRLPSPKPAKIPPPMDERTTLDGMVVRMLPKNDKDVPFYQKALQDMDTMFKISQRLVEEYNRPTFLPRVHAELILLEHFHTHQYDFVDGDKYIGCSKPACYCCYHYICAHPGNFVRPASHNKTYLNWRPPDAADVGEDGPAAMQQRDIINDMVKMIRKDVLAQIQSQRPRHRWHPDSTTGITASVVVNGSW